jgi:Na+/H+ antiporter NhaD/arsenite permease-like protein
MILAASENMGFNDFFFMQGRPGIFWAVQAGAFASFFVLWKHLGKNRDAVPRVKVTPVASWVPVVILAVVIAGLALISLFESGVGTMAGLLCAGGGAASVVWYALYRRGRTALGAWKRTPGRLLAAFDLDTLFLLAGIFFMWRLWRNSGSWKPPGLSGQSRRLQPPGGLRHDRGWLYADSAPSWTTYPS